MPRAARRCPPLAFLALLLLLGGLPGRALALSEIEDVSKARAKELGISVLLKPRTDDVWVQVQFKTAGPMKEFRWADLAVTQVETRLVSATLKPQKPTPDSVRLDCYLHPTTLTGSALTIFVYNDPRAAGGIGYRLQLKDFPVASASR